VNHHPTHSHCSQLTLCHISVAHPDEGRGLLTPSVHHYTVPSYDKRIQIQSLCHYKKRYPINVGSNHSLTAPVCIQLAYFTALYVAEVRSPSMGGWNKQICLQQRSHFFLKTWICVLPLLTRTSTCFTLLPILTYGQLNGLPLYTVPQYGMSILSRTMFFLFSNAQHRLLSPL
jgi:hypothetical protein